MTCGVCNKRKIKYARRLNNSGGIVLLGVGKLLPEEVVCNPRGKLKEPPHGDHGL